MKTSTVPSSELDDFGTWYAARRRRTKGRGPSGSTIRTKRIHLRTVCALLDAPNLEVLAEHCSVRVKVEHLLDELSVRMQPGSMQSVIYALLDFHQYAEAKGWPGSTVARSDVPAKNPAPPITIYTDTELETFVSAARGSDLHWWALLSFLAYSGRRIGEALSLEWDWLKQEAEPPYFELPFQKNGNPQYIPFGAKLSAVFTPENIYKMQTSGRATLRRNPKEFVFPGSYSSYYGMFKRFCEKTGLPNRGFHNFRHTVITNRLIAGVPLQAVAALAGHANPGITGQRYNHATALNFARYVD